MSGRAGITSNTVPWEILRAAGYSPRLLEYEPGPTPFADRYMEDVFDRRIRVIFDRLCSRTWNDLDLVVLPRTSEQEHKLYLYLREAARENPSGVIPRVYLYDLLHTRNPESYSYGLERTRQMVRDFEVSDKALREAIEESNQARSAVRAIQEQRFGGFLEGSAAHNLIRRFYTENRAEFTDRVPIELQALCLPEPTHRPHILVKGSPLDGAEVHHLVERCGGYVVAEDDWRGSRAGGEKVVKLDGDPVTAVFEKYFYDEVSPRIHLSIERDAWFRQIVESRNIDGVLFFIPLEEDVVGWDYPRQIAWLTEERLPSTLIRDVSDETRVAAFIKGLSPN